MILMLLFVSMPFAFGLGFIVLGIELKKQKSDHKISLLERFMTRFGMFLLEPRDEISSEDKAAEYFHTAILFISMGIMSSIICIFPLVLSR